MSLDVENADETLFNLSIYIERILKTRGVEWNNIGLAITIGSNAHTISESWMIANYKNIQIAAQLDQLKAKMRNFIFDYKEALQVATQNTQAKPQKGKQKRQK